MEQSRCATTGTFASCYATTSTATITSAYKGSYATISTATIARTYNGCYATSSTATITSTYKGSYTTISTSTYIHCSTAIIKSRRILFWNAPIGPSTIKTTNNLS
jgi:hypothetical protein